MQVYVLIFNRKVSCIDEWCDRCRARGAPPTCPICRAIVTAPHRPSSNGGSVILSPQNRATTTMMATTAATTAATTTRRWRRRSFERFSKNRSRRCDSFGPKIVKIRAILAIFRPFEVPNDFQETVIPGDSITDTAVPSTPALPKRSYFSDLIFKNSLSFSLLAYCIVASLFLK